MPLLEEQTASEAIVLQEARAATYSFLAQLYSKEIDAELLGHLKNLDFSPLGEVCNNEENGIALMQNYLSGAAEDEETLTRLAVDFASVFLGMNKSQDGAYPYESVYTSEQGLLMQEAAEEALLAYRREGISQNMNYSVPDDHVALELSFMAHLCQKAAQSDKKSEQATVSSLNYKQAQFVEDHLGRWIPLFCKKCILLATTDFYRGLAMLTQNFIESERIHLRAYA